MQLLARMRYYPAYDEFVELARGQETWSRSSGNWPVDTLTPVSRVLQDPGGRLGVFIRERRRRRASGPV